MRKQHILLLLAILSSFPWARHSAWAQKPQSDAELTLQKAQELFRDGNFPGALTAFQKLEDQLSLSSFSPQVIYFEGSCLAAEHHNRQAADTYARLITNYPHSPIVSEAIFEEAECYRELNDFPKAMALYHQCLAQPEPNALVPQVMLGEAWVSHQQHDRKAATEIMEKERTQFANDPVASLGAQFLLGAIRLSENDYDAARDIYQQIASQENNPRAAEALFLAGEAMLDAKRYADALAFYERVQSKDGVSDQLHAFSLFRKANCYQLLLRFTEANAAYQEFLKIWPEVPLAEHARLALAQIQVELHRPVEAELAVKAFQKKYPSSSLAVDATLLQGEALFNSGKFREALGLFQNLAVDSQDKAVAEKAAFRIATCYYELHDFGAARNSFEMVTRRFSSSALVPDALFFMGRCHADVARSSADPHAAETNLLVAANGLELIRTRYPTNELLPEVIFQLGYLYSYLGAYNTTNYDKAGASFQEFIDRWPDHRLVPEALYQLAHVRFAQSQFEAAIAEYKQLADKFPDHDLTPFALYEMAGCYAAANQPTQVTMALSNFLKRYPNHVRAADAFYAVASQFKDSRTPADFNTALERLASQSPNNINERIAADTVAIESALDREDTQQAYTIASRLLVGPGKDHLPSVSCLAIGDTLLHRGRFAQAQSLFQRGLALDPKNSRTTNLARLGMAEADLGLNQLDAAEDLFNKVLATHPQGQVHVKAQLGLAKVYFAKGKNAVADDIADMNAVDLLSQVLANSDPKGAGEAAFLLGNHLANLPDNKAENTRAALVYYRHAAALLRGAHGEEAVFRAGQCYKFLGNAAAARGAFETYLRYFPKGELAAEVRRELASSPATPFAGSDLPITIAAQSGDFDSRHGDLEFSDKPITVGDNTPLPRRYSRVLSVAHAHRFRRSAVRFYHQNRD